MCRSGIKKQRILLRLLVGLVSGALVLLGLYHAENRIPRAGAENGVVRLSAEQLRSGLWLISEDAGEASDRTRIRLELEGGAACCLYLPSEPDMGLLRVNGAPPDFFFMGYSAIAVLPAGERSLTLEYQEAPGNPLLLSSHPVYVGAREQVIRRVQRDQAGQGMLQGVFLFSTLYALTLFMFKRSEKYLLPYAVHALIPQVLIQYPVWKAEFFAWASAHAPALAAALSMKLPPALSSFWQYSYVFFTGMIHWLICREFVDDRLGRRPYPVYLAAVYVLLSILGLCAPSVFEGFVIFYAFYFIMYLLEGVMLLRNPGRERSEFFVLALVAGWAVSLVFWLVRTANNLDWISYPFSLGSQVALGYTFSFLICINGKFASKFRQADQVLAGTRLLNDSLEQQVAERTQELQTAMEDLKATHESKDRFVANIIHNLKTPLFSLKGYAELLKEQTGDENPEATEYLGYISGNVDYVQKLIQQLLLFDRLEEKRIRFQFAPIPAGPFLDALRQAAQTAGREKQLCVRLENTLPPGFSFDGDRFYLEQAMLNLLENAVQHSPPGGSIVLRAEERPSEDGTGACLLLSVRDRGEGMSEETMSHIFERGYSRRADGGKSSGLGLNIALSIARNHGGGIEVESRPGEGSCFMLELPAGAGQPAEESV